MMNRQNRLDKVRKALKDSEEPEMDMPMLDEAFFERMHDQIMMAVENTEMEPPKAWHKSRNFLRAHWRGWLYPTSSVTSLVAVLFLVVPQVSKITQTMQRVGLYSDGLERIVSQALNSPEEWDQTFINSENETDFFIDVANESSDTLSVAKFNKLMGDNRN